MTVEWYYQSHRRQEIGECVKILKHAELRLQKRINALSTLIFADTISQLESMSAREMNAGSLD